MRWVYVSLLWAVGCGPRTVVINGSSLDLVSILARSGDQRVPPDRFDPPLSPGEEAPMSWHVPLGNRSIYHRIELEFADGTEVTLVRTVAGPPPDSFLFTDADLVR